eukprot:431863-Pyramimonas_sp.AAC.1
MCLSNATCLVSSAELLIFMHSIARRRHPHAGARNGGAPRGPQIWTGWRSQEDGRKCIGY